MKDRFELVILFFGGFAVIFDNNILVWYLNSLVIFYTAVEVIAVDKNCQNSNYMNPMYPNTILLKLHNN